MDKLTLERIKLLHPKLREEALEIYSEICNVFKDNILKRGKVMCRFTHTLRTFEEQNALYAKGREIQHTRKVTNARGGYSYHNYGLAVDIVLILDKDGNGTYESVSWDTILDFDGDGKSDWEEVVYIFKKYGWTAGIDWKFVDAPHFEKSFGYSVIQLLNLKNNNKVDTEGYVLI